jgi:hypothetical protein
MKNTQSVGQFVSEFACTPVRCKKEYRVVVVWKDLEVHQGQKKLFDDVRCFFYIANDWDLSAEEVVRSAHQRYQQEKLIEQQKNGVRTLTAPLDNLTSNWASMVIASRAWSLKAWCAMQLPEVGPKRADRAATKRRSETTSQNTIVNPTSVA